MCRLVVSRGDALLMGCGHHGMCPPRRAGAYAYLSNSSYYALDPSDLAAYANRSACGNDLRTAHPVVRRLVVDSLRYWAREMGVDGFRFDLASIFTRNEDGTINRDHPPIISEITSDPDLMDVRLIAEPWQAWLPSSAADRQ